MDDNEEIEVVYTKKEDIDRIIENIRNTSFEKLEKRGHYYKSIMEKDTDEDEIKKYYPQFDRIKMIMLRKRKSGYNNYDLHYLKDDGTFILIAINTEKIPPELVNAYPVNRNFKQFMQSIVRYYRDKMI